MRAGDVPRQGRQALEGLALVFEAALGGDDRLVLAPAPFARDDRAGNEVQFARGRPLGDLRVRGADALQALPRGRRQPAEGFLLQLVGDARFNEVAVRLGRTVIEIPVPQFPELGHGCAAQFGDAGGDGGWVGVHHNVSR